MIKDNNAVDLRVVGDAREVYRCALGVAAIVVLTAVAGILSHGLVLAALPLLFLSYWLRSSLGYRSFTSKNTRLSPKRYPQIYQDVHLFSMQLRIPFPIYVYTAAKPLSAPARPDKPMIIIPETLLYGYSEHAPNRLMLWYLARELAYFKLLHRRSWCVYLIEMFRQIGLLDPAFSAWRRSLHYAADRMAFTMVSDLNVAIKGIAYRQLGQSLLDNTTISATLAHYSTLSQRVAGRFGEYLEATPSMNQRINQLLAWGKQKLPADFAVNETQLEGCAEPKLLLTCGSKILGEYVIDQDSVSIGRDTENDIRVIHKEISAKHARIIRRGDRHFIEDLNSKNGTFIDGRRVKSRMLRDGEVVCIASYELRYFAPQRKADRNQKMVA